MQEYFREVYMGNPGSIDILYKFLKEDYYV